MVAVSVVVPSRKEQFLSQTIQDLLDKARGEIEIIVLLEGYWPPGDEINNDPRVRYLHFTTPRGMRGAINAGAAVARGKYLMKCDAHCMFDEGYDVKLAADLEPNWIAVPRRYSLDAEQWEPKSKKAIDYMYLCAPTDPNDYGGPSLHGRTWRDKQNDASLKEVLIDDLMSAQGSCWFMHRDYFNWLEILDDVNYGHFCFEFQEIGLKCWLSGGRVIRNKKTWYAHLHKGRKYGRGWPLGKSTLRKGAAYSNRWMAGKLWHKQTRDIRAFVHDFEPVPTWDDKSIRFVFHRRRGGSGEIRGSQMAKYFLARINPPEGWVYDFDVHIWVKQQPAKDYQPNSWLDILDEPRRIPWLREHPDVGVIASSDTSLDFLRSKLGNDRRIVFIPQHHCNYDNYTNPDRGIFNVGVIGGQGALQLDIEELKRRLIKIGVNLIWRKQYTKRKDVCAFYAGIDAQVVFRKQDRPLKNPLKLINAMSFGIPTIARSEVAYREVDGYYTPARNIDEIVSAILDLRRGYDKKALVDRAAMYHITEISKLYEELL